MSEFRLSTPVAFFIFNRPQTTEHVFEAIRAARPSKLFVIADGPRWNYPGDPENCEAARRVIERVDWECEVLTNYADLNLGCNERIVSGLNWVFEQVEEAIILEDDCVPHPSFFPFCQELLEKYRHDERMMMISGNNFHFGRKRTDNSYFFSRVFLNHIWGWATWRRAWRMYNPAMMQWPKIRKNGWLFDILTDKPAVNFYDHHFEGQRAGRLRLSWDYIWCYSCWMENGLSIAPNMNLVTNIGFGPGATYAASYSSSEMSNVPVSSVEFPLRHPNFVVQDTLGDRYLLAKFTSMPDADPKSSRKKKRRKEKRRKLIKRTTKKTKVAKRRIKRNISIRRLSRKAKGLNRLRSRSSKTKILKAKKTTVKKSR